jgi:hypothetical protein
MEDFRELHNNMVPKKHDSQNNTPLNITPLTHVSRVVINDKRGSNLSYKDVTDGRTVGSIH